MQKPWLRQGTEADAAHPPSVCPSDLRLHELFVFRRCGHCTTLLVRLLVIIVRLVEDVLEAKAARHRGGDTLQPLLQKRKGR